MQALAQVRKARPDTYSRVFDSRKRRVRGMWQRNGRYFANVTVTDDLSRKSTKMVPLSGATLDEARDDYRRLLSERDDDRLRPLGQVPTFREFSIEHRKELDASGKRASTLVKEKGYLSHWDERIGHIRLNKIRPFHLSRVLTELSEQTYSGRSVNLYLIAIRGALKAALRHGHIKPPLPFEGLAWQRVDQRARELYLPEEIDVICEAALKQSKNGRSFVDYIRFLQYSGARRDEALRVRWCDVILDRGHVTIGAEGDSKNREARYVDLNPKLEEHLRQMQERRQPDSEWLFPSPQRGDDDVHVQTYRESLDLARNTPGIVCSSCAGITVGGDVTRCGKCGSDAFEVKDKVLPRKLREFGFHDLRHHFISYAVMSGVDYMTIARWVGHKDGGILIGKVYGHLADSHRKAQAARVTFGS